jgi:hypothetical protein
LHSLNSFTDDIGLRREPRDSALPKFPSSVSDGGWFRGYTGSLFRCGLSSCSPPCTDLTRNFPQPTGTFTPELPASRSPFSSSGITTVATERFHRWDFHPLERQLASLHGLLHLRVPRHPTAIHNNAVKLTYFPNGSFGVFKQDSSSTSIASRLIGDELFVAQGYEGIDAGGATRGDVARGKSHDCEQGCGPAEAQRVARR